jgi:hypothetical protein
VLLANSSGLRPVQDSRGDLTPPLVPWACPQNWLLQSCNRQHVTSIWRKARCEQNKWRWGTHLSPFLWKAYQAGCCIKAVLHTVVTWLHALRHPRKLIFLSHPLALQANHPCHASARAQFDTVLFAVGIDNHASRCMGNNKRLFENLILTHTAQGVRGISKGLAKECKGTLVLDVNNDTGKPHHIKIPNSLSLPGLRMCLLSPQHWAQEAGDNYPPPNGTRMESNAHNCILLWGQGRYSKRIPFNAMTNTPIFHMLLLPSSYCAFVNTFMACKAPFFSRKRVLQLMGRHWLDGIAPPLEKLVTKENVNFENQGKQASEGVAHAEDDTVSTSNLPPPPKLAPQPDLLRWDALTFDPSPVLKETNKYSVDTPDDQAELMRWHFHLGHASFPKLKQLARIGKIPAKFTNIRPPCCAGFLFGAMTKVPWGTKDHHDNDHSVFATTKPGGVRLCQSHAVNGARVLWPSKRHTHQNLLPQRHDLCQSLLPAQVCLPDDE